MKKKNDGSSKITVGKKDPGATRTRKTGIRKSTAKNSAAARALSYRPLLMLPTVEKYRIPRKIRTARRPTTPKPK
jgi:hypothetical protein